MRSFSHGAGEKWTTVLAAGGFLSKIVSATTQSFFQLEGDRSHNNNHIRKGCEQYKKQPEKFLDPEFLMKMPVLGNSGDSARKTATPPDELQPLRGPVPIWVTLRRTLRFAGQQFEWETNTDPRPDAARLSSGGLGVWLLPL